MKKGNRILACFLAFALTVTALELPARAVTVDVADGNNFKPLQPTIAAAEGQIQITSANEENNSIQIQANQSANEFTLVLELLKDGGVRLYDRDSCNTMFQKNISALKDTITVTQDAEVVIATGTTSGVRVALNYENASAWVLDIYQKDSDIVSYTINANELLVQYDGKERTNVSLCGEIASGEQFIGLGERYTGTILNGKTYSLWNEDCWSAGLYGDKTTSYTNVPLLHSSNGYSLFFNSFYSATADIGAEGNPDMYQLNFDGPDLDIFLWTDTPLENVKSYMSVTGTTATIPKWATGYWAGGDTNHYWYNIAKKYYDADTSKSDTAVVADYYDEAMREILQNYKDMGTMPTAVFGEATPTRVLDTVSAVSSEFGVELLGWYHPDQPWDADEYRMINKNVLTSLKGFSATEELPFIKTTSGEYYTYTNDGGKSQWNRVDYTHSNAEKLVTANLSRGWNKDLSGLMVDYGEYINADWFFANGKTGKEMHNQQAYYYNSVMRNAWENSAKADDYVLFARAGSAGSQSFAAQFGGDQKCNFEGLRQAVMGGLSASASGFGIWGSDIGGLGTGPSESENNPLLTAELYMRWLGFGTFSTLMRTHSTMDHDPWTFAEEVKLEGLDVDVKEVFKKYYWTRENLSDAIYSATLQSNKDGTPVMQVMGLAYPEHFSVGDQYLFCNEMLVAPVYEEGNTAINGTVSKSITIPKGKWYDLWNGKCIEGSGTAIAVDVPVDETPVYLRSGGVMPVDLSAKTFKLADSMEGDDHVQALFVTPTEEGKSRTSTWYIGEDENSPGFTYTSQTLEGEYTIHAGQTSDNPKVLRGYGIKTFNVSVDGARITRLYHEPIGDETGFYVNEGTGEMVLVLEDGDWEHIVFNDDAEITYDKIDFHNIDVASLDEKGFSSTQFSKSDYVNATESNQLVAKHWFSGNGDGTPYITRKGEEGVKIWYSNPNTGMKPTSANKDNTLTILNTPYQYENFQISTEICYGYSTGIVLGPQNVYPTAANSPAIRIYFANGRIQLVGALDNSKAVASDETSWNTSGTTGLFLAKDTLSANKTYTLNVRMEKDVLTIWVDGFDTILTIETAEHYEAESIAFMASKFDEDGGGILSFEIQELDSEEFCFDNIDISKLEKEGFTSTQFDKEKNYDIVGDAGQAVSTHWFSGDTGIQPVATDADKKVQLLNTPYSYKNFKISTDIYWGVYTGVVIGEKNVYPRNTSEYAAISVYFANNRIQLDGAVNYDKAEVKGKENGWGTYEDTGIFYFADNFKATKHAVYTLNVEMQDGVLTVWVDGYPGVLTIEVAEHYETGAIAFRSHKQDGDGGGIKSFTIDEIRTHYEVYTADEFASYREENDFEAPTEAGYLFAGWFYDELGKKAVQSNVTTTEHHVYAKFVPKSILTVKAQLSTNLLDENPANDSSGSIRFVTTIDTLRYKKVGFKVSYDKGDGMGIQNRVSASKKVYTKLFAVLGDASGGTIRYRPTEFHCSSTYFKAVTIRGIVEELYNMTFTITPFWQTLDGTEVCGETVERSIRQGIE